MNAIQWLRNSMSPEQRHVIGAEAKQALENKHWNEALDAVQDYLVEGAKACDPDNKEKAARIVISMQLLEAIKRELIRKIEDGDMAAVEIEQIERARGRTRFFER